MAVSTTRRFVRASGLFILIGAAVAVLVWRPPVIATHKPANKVIAAGSGLEAFRVGSPTSGVGTNVDARRILSGTLRTSTPADLILGVSLECALWTQTSTASDETRGVDSSETTAQVKAWITIDGGADPNAGVVKVSADDTLEPGKVVFCNRAQKMDVEFFDTDGEDDTDDQLLIKSYLRTRTANSFSWLALNLGNGIHTITLWAELSAGITAFDAPFGTHSDGVTEPAAAAVGKRTMIVEPAKMANDATVEKGF